MNSDLEQCLVCERSSMEVPLVHIRHQGNSLWICPQHFPILIHQPMKLADRLPGVKNLGAPAEH